MAVAQKEKARQTHTGGASTPSERRRSNRGELRIGTSGWHYADWWGKFYPRELKKKDALGYYVTQFNATELNAPFYRTPTPKAVTNWTEAAPEDFRFSWKASRFITHFRRLIYNAKSMQLLERRLHRMSTMLGPVLFQLPPQMQVDGERLAAFLERLPKGHRYTFEFRHGSWYEQPVFDLLGEHDAALCISDHIDAPAPHEVTAGFVYIRNHGSSGRYRGHYPKPALQQWATEIRRWRRQGRDVWCFFDNDIKSAAPADAELLRRMSER